MIFFKMSSKKQLGPFTVTAWATKDGQTILNLIIFRILLTSYLHSYQMH